jgi:hypothetical protein
VFLDPHYYLFSSTNFQVTDPSFDCSGQQSVNFATIRGAGAKQHTGRSASPAQSVTTCAIVNGQGVVTAHIAVPSGISPGMAYMLTVPQFAPANGLTVHSFCRLSDIGVFGDA